MRWQEPGYGDRDERDMTGSQQGPYFVASVGVLVAPLLLRLSVGDDLGGLDEDRAALRDERTARHRIDHREARVVPTNRRCRLSAVAGVPARDGAGSANRLSRQALPASGRRGPASTLRCHRPGQGREIWQREVKAGMVEEPPVMPLRGRTERPVDAETPCGRVADTAVANGLGEALKRIAPRLGWCTTSSTNVARRGERTATRD